MSSFFARMYSRTYTALFRRRRHRSPVRTQRTRTHTHIHARTHTHRTSRARKRCTHPIATLLRCAFVCRTAACSGARPEQFAQVCLAHVALLHCAALLRAQAACSGCVLGARGQPSGDMGSKGSKGPKVAHASQGSELWCCSERTHWTVPRLRRPRNRESGPRGGDPRRRRRYNRSPCRHCIYVYICIHGLVGTARGDRTEDVSPE